MKLYPKSGAIVFHTDCCVLSWAAGTAYGPIIFIRPKHKESEGLLQHELVHTRQFWRTFGLHGILYLVSKKYRLNAEVEAYCESMKHNQPSSVYWFADMLVKHYRLNITKEEAVRRLKNC